MTRAEYCLMGFSLVIVIGKSASAQASLSPVEFLALQQELRDQGCGVTKVDATYTEEMRRAIATCAKKFNTANNARSLLNKLDIGFGPDDIPVDVTVPVETAIANEVTRVLGYSANDRSGALNVSVNYVKVPVFFATRRKPTGRANPEAFFGGTDDRLRYGIALVSVERRRRPAKSDSGSWLCVLTKCNDPIHRTILIDRTDTVSEANWIKRAQLARPDTQPSGLIFVHGFNVGFADAMKAAGQIAYDTGFQGLTLAFDWASKGDPKLYGPDQETAERSVKDLKTFLRLVADSLQIHPINIIAHSLGTRLVSYALRDLETEAPAIPFGQLVFAAADIDSATFVDQIADKITRRMRRVTLYASSNDRALQVSGAGLVHASPRVGSGPPHFILHDRLDYVDASNVETDFWGHGYYKESKPIIDDIYMLLHWNATASQRNLDSVQLGSQSYYMMK